MADLIPDDQVSLDQAQAPAAGMVPSAVPAASATSIPDNEVQLDAKPTNDIPDEAVTLDSDKYGTLGQQVGAAVEGGLQGLLGPLAPLAEKVAGIPAEDIAGRAAANPWTHGIAEAGTLVGSTLIGIPGIAGAASGLAEAAAHSAEFGKLGSAVIKGAIEGGIFQASDEATKGILGQGDPTAPVASALANVGLAGAISAVLGGVLSPIGTTLRSIGEAKAGTAAAQFGQDFGNRLQKLASGVDTGAAVTQELSDFYSTTKASLDGAWDLKDQAINKLVPKEITPEISDQTQSIYNTLQDKIKEMAADPDTYPPRYVKQMENYANKWAEVATKEGATTADQFNATQELKRTLQTQARFGKRLAPDSQMLGFVGASKEVGHTLREALEDPQVWGEAGTLQKKMNTAYSKFQTPLEEFESKFASGLEGEKQVDPGSVQTYVNQAGKATAKGFRAEKLSNFIQAAGKLRDSISDLYNLHGLESPVSPVSLNETNALLSAKPSPGAALANYMHDKLPSLATKVAATAAGGLTGGVSGAIAAREAAPFLEKFIGRPVSDKMVPVVLKLLGNGETAGLWKALDYAQSAAKGAQQIRNSTGMLFKAGSQQVFDTVADQKEQERIKDLVQQGGLAGQLPSAVQQAQPSSPPTPQFAEGGSVAAPEAPDAPLSSGGPSEPAKTGLAAHFPEQNLALSATTGRSLAYLNSIRPQPHDTKLPFDEATKNEEHEKQYGRAVNLAQQPLSILNHIQDGSLTPDHMRHFTSMFPEMHSHLSKLLMDKVTKAQMAGDTIPYHKRQALSMFLGTALDSSLTPLAIQAAQATFQNQASQPASNAPQTKTKKNTSKLGQYPEQYQTMTDAREKRQMSQSAKMIGK